MLNNYYQVLTRETPYCIRKADPDDEWDCGDDGVDTEVLGLKLVNKKEHFDGTAPFDIQTGKVYYLLYVVYSTGCSFGFSKGNIEYIGLYDDLLPAQTNKDIITSSPTDSSLKLVDCDGKENKRSTYCPWVGHFEALQEVVIKPVRVLENRSK